MVHSRPEEDLASIQRNEGHDRTIRCLSTHLPTVRGNSRPRASARGPACGCERAAAWRGRPDNRSWRWHRSAMGSALRRVRNLGAHTTGDLERAIESAKTEAHGEAWYERNPD